MHSNLDCAIAFVIGRGEQLNVPNVFSAYLQAVIYPVSYDDGLLETDDAVARAALITFERAMDKYPMPAPPPKASKSSRKTPAALPEAIPPSTAGKDGVKRYSAEVAQLRWEYQQAMLSATTEDAYPSCTCMSCGGLLSLGERLSALTSEGEDGEQMLDPPVRVRRTRKTKKQTGKKAQPSRATPFDPYAPSTSAAAAP